MHYQLILSSAIIPLPNTVLDHLRPLDSLEPDGLWARAEMVDATGVQPYGVTAHLGCRLVAVRNRTAGRNYVIGGQGTTVRPVNTMVNWRCFPRELELYLVIRFDFEQKV